MPAPSQAPKLNLSALCLQHNKEREAWHRIKEKDPALAARIEASAALPDAEEVEAGDDAEGSSSDDDEVRQLQSHVVRQAACGS